MDSRTTPQAANQATTGVGEQETAVTGTDPSPSVERRAPRSGRQGDPVAGTPSGDDTAAQTPPAQFRRRKDDDPASPLPARGGAVQPTGFGAYSVGHAIRYLRRSTDALPPGTPPPSIDVVTPALRQRLLDADAAGTARPRLFSAGAWRWPVLVVVGIAALLALSWLTAGW